MKTETDTKNLNPYPGRRFISANRSAIIGFVVFSILAILVGGIIYMQYRNVRKKQDNKTLEMANIVKERLQESLSSSMSATRIMAFFIDKDGQVKNFDAVAEQVLKTHKYIDAVQLVPDGIVKYVYPEDGNKKVLGYNILRDSTRNKEAYKSIEKNVLFFSGPYELRQGGRGVVGRLPVYRNGKFWGFSAVVIRMSTLLKAAEIDSSGKSGYYFQLSKINPVTQQEEYFIRHARHLSTANSVSVDVPNGEWRLSVIPVNPYKGISDMVFLLLLGLTCALMGGYLAYNESGKPAKLNELVSERTRQLKESEEKFYKAFHSNALGFAICDFDFRFIDVNESYAAILGCNRDFLIGKTADEVGIVSRMDPERRTYISKHIEDVLNAEGQLHNLETQIRLDGDKEATILLSIEKIELHSKIFWLISAVDISDKKNAEKLLEKSELKYRSLIEQASDGIVISDLKGIVLEVNKSICNMGGYLLEDVIGKRLDEFIPQKDITEKPLKLDDLLQGKSVLNERQLLKKDGSLLDVEINARMTSTGNLISFARDITERKKKDEMIRYQARLLESVTDAVVSVNNDRKIVSWNYACEEMFGYKAEEVLGKETTDFLKVEYPGITREEIYEQVFRNGNWKGEFSFIHPHDNQKHYMLSSLSVLKDSNDNNIGFIITSHDITDRKIAEEKIRKTNERYELIAQATNEIIWDHDMVHNETRGNRKLYELYSPEVANQKITFETFIDHIHPDEREGVVQRMYRALENKVSSSVEEFRFRMANGEYRYFFDRAYIKYDENGVPVRILGAMQDVTERETIRKQILKEKELSDSIINSLPGIFYLFNKDGKYKRWNRNFETVTGYNAVDIQKLHPLDLFSGKEKAMIAEKMERVFITGQDTAEAELIAKSGTRIPFYFTGQAIEYEGEECLMGVGLDFSEMKKAQKVIKANEERYRALVDTATEALVVINLEKGKFVNVSDSAVNLFKMSREELLQIGPVEVSPKYQPGGALSADAAMEKIMEAVHGGKPSFEWTHMDKLGNLIPCEVWLVSLPSENEKLIRGTVIDITERKKAAEEIRANSELLRELYGNLQNVREEERTHIAREIHDELGQQLTGLKMDMFWINRRLKSEDPAINEKLVSTLQLIDTTIETVRKIATELRPSILDDLGLVAALDWQSEEFGKRSNIHVDFTGNLHDYVPLPAISTALFRIYQELLTNVGRHAKASEVKSSLYRDEENLYLKVEDNGEGFDLKNIRNKKTLGLRGINERTGLIGGIYEIKSTPGMGTSVLISVPLHNT